MARVSVILIHAILKLPVLKGAAKSRISYENNIANGITNEVSVPRLYQYDQWIHTSIYFIVVVHMDLL